MILPLPKKQPHLYINLNHIYINRNVFHSFKFKHSWSKFVKIYVKIVGIKHTF